MNRTPTPEKTEIRRPEAPLATPRTPRPDLTTLILFTVAAVAVLMVILCLSVLHFGGIGSPSDDPSKDTTAPPDTEAHVPVVYPTTPTRDDYRLNGNGAAINSETISASSAILVSLKDYSVKASIEADAKIYPASMTKIMTLIVACENLEDGSAILTVDHDTYDFCSKMQATTLVSISEKYPVANDSYTATDLLYSVGVISAADACIVLAEHIAGSEEAFVEKMNAKVAELGLTNTHFANCTGLDDDNNYSTVREMAVILAYALDNPFCREVLSTYMKTASGTYNGDTPLTYNRYLSNTIVSRLKAAGLKEELPAKLAKDMTLLGGKTGYTDNGKYCLASFLSDADGNLYITVTAAGETSASSVTDIDAILTAAG